MTDPGGNHCGSNPVKVHQSRARMPRCVELDVANTCRLHGVTPVSRENRRRVRLPDFIAHHVVPRTACAAKGQPFRRLPSFCSPQNRDQTLRQWQGPSRGGRLRAVLNSPPASRHAVVRDRKVACVQVHVRPPQPRHFATAQAGQGKFPSITKSVVCDSTEQHQNFGFGVGVNMLMRHSDAANQLCHVTRHDALTLRICKHLFSRRYHLVDRFCRPWLPPPPFGGRSPAGDKVCDQGVDVRLAESLNGQVAEPLTQWR